MSEARGARERRAVGLAAAAQFLVLLDFALLLPLGPDLVEPLAIPASSLGLLIAAYTGAAAVSGLVVARILDRFDRRWALAATVLGLAVASGSAALATGFASFALARVVAGLFGAPTSALVMALISDEVPAVRRGRALAVVLSANAVAAVLGVPAALWLAGAFGWWTAFAFVGVVGLGVAAVVSLGARGPVRQTSHPASSAGPEPDSSRVAAPASSTVILAHLLVFVVYASAFALSANLSAYVQLNLGLPRAAIPGLYMVAGVASLAAMRLSGWAVDRRGAFVVGTGAILGLSVLVGVFLAIEDPLIGTGLAFIVALALLGSRNVCVRTLTSRVPGPSTRGRFMSVQAASQQLGAVAGAAVGAALLYDMPDGRLGGMQVLARVSMAVFVTIPVLLRVIEGRLAKTGCSIQDPA